MPYSDFSPEQQAEFNALAYMIISLAALVGAVALVAWAIWA